MYRSTVDAKKQKQKQNPSWVTYGAHIVHKWWFKIFLENLI